MLSIKNRLIWLLPFLGFYILLILVHGYTFGSNDQMDFMPYARHLQDPTLYVNDFYISCIGDRYNERWILAHFTSFIPHSLWPISFLFIHCCSTILLLWGLKIWVAQFIKNEWMQWFCLFIVLILLYHRNLGGNELYYNMVCASLIAKSIAVWALYSAYRSSLVHAIFLTILCAYIHPIVGAQILILSFVIVPSGFKLKYLLFSILGIAPYLFFLLYDLNDSIPAVEFAQIMHLRNAHHFFPEEFGRINYIMLIPLYLLGTVLFYKIDKRIFSMMLIVMIGCLLYSLMMISAPKYAILTQWFKTTIWIKFLSIIGILYFIQSITKPYAQLQIIIVSTCLIATFTLLKLYKNSITAVTFYQFPWSSHQAELIVSLDAKAQSLPDDIFLVPADFTSFKYYSERSTYVDWKAIPHNGQCLHDWKDRILKAYDISDQMNGSLDKLYMASNLHLSNLTGLQKTILKAEGVDFIISRSKLTGKYSIEKLQ